MHHEIDIIKLHDRRKDMDLHQRNLKNPQKAINNELPFSYRHKQHLHTHRLKLIHDRVKDNDKIRQRLEDIYNRKKLSASMKIPVRKSLNIEKRIKEEKRIIEANREIALKIVQQSSPFSRRQLDRSYQNIRTYKKLISKTAKALRTQKAVDGFLLPKLSVPVK